MVCLINKKQQQLTPSPSKSNHSISFVIIAKSQFYIVSRNFTTTEEKKKKHQHTNTQLIYFCINLTNAIKIKALKFTRLILATVLKSSNSQKPQTVYLHKHICIVHKVGKKTARNFKYRCFSRIVSFGLAVIVAAKISIRIRNFMKN